MSRINHVLFQGKIFRVGEKRQVNGKSVIELRIRQSYPKGKRKQNPAPEDFHTDWMTVKAWGQTADIAEGLEKDDWITVEGRLRHEEWKDKTTGSHREKTVLVASFLHRTPGTFKDVTASQPSEEFQPQPVDSDPFPAEGDNPVPF